MKKIDIKDIGVNYHIKRSKRRSIAVMVVGENTIEIKAPYKVTENYIVSLVLSKEEWILRQLSKYKEFKKELEFHNMVSYLGKPIKIQNNLKSVNNTEIMLKEGNIIVFSKEKMEKDEMRQIISTFLKEEAKKILGDRTRYYQELIGVRVNKIVVKDVKSIWGSCSIKNNINYNYRIIMAPMEVIDYLVVHELSHILYRNHSKEYWKAVEKFIPDYKERRNYLKKNGYKFAI